ncbi:MAG: universal stress protein, partial [Acidimicrobiales bacterium]
SAAAQMIAEEAAALAREMGATKTTARAISGEPADAILEEANEIGVDLIVVGSRGMRSAARRLLGAVPNKVVHNAGCDVLVVETAG